MARMKSPAQLDREINAALSKSRGKQRKQPGAAISWHEQIKQAMIDLYGSPGDDLDEVDLDDYRGMDPQAAAEKIAVDARALRRRRATTS